MRIGIDARAAGGATDGIGRYARELLGAYAERGDDNRYVILRSAGSRQSFAFDERFTELVTPLERFGVREQWTLPRLLGGLHVDLVHSLHAALPLFYRGVKVMTVHDIFPVLLPWTFGRTDVKNALASSYYERLVRWSMRSAALTIVDSDHTGMDLRNHLAADARRLRRIYLGADHVQGGTASGGGGTVSRNGLGTVYLLTVTNFKPHKNTSKVIEAFRIARKEMPELQLAVIGNDPRDFAGGLGTPAQLQSEGIRMLGYVSDSEMKSLLASAMAFVFPSLYEGFGFPVLESMAAGTPVVTSAVASIPEVGGDAVLYADPNDAADIARAIVLVCRDANLRSSLQVKGRTQAAKFQWKETAAQTIGVYNEAVQLTRSARR